MTPPDASCEGGLPEWFYHGTSTLYLDQMLEQGLMPCTMTGAVHMTCLADDPEIAIHHALCMAEFEEAEPIVFRIPAARLDPSRFTLEDKFAELGPSAGRGLQLQEEMGVDAWEAAPWTWRSMLEAAGAVGYTAPIPVTLDDLLPEYSPGPRLAAAAA